MAHSLLYKICADANSQEDQEMKNKRLTVWEAACIITGNGIGAGVLAIPYIAQKNGVIITVLIIAVSFAASWLLHMMIAEAVNKCPDGSQIVSIFSRFLFNGKYGKPLSLGFFALMAIVLITNLTAFITGAANVLADLLHISVPAAELIFYVVATSVAVFGLKAVGISEKYSISGIFVIVGILALSSLFKPINSLSLFSGSGKELLSLFGMVMFALCSFFSIPQAVDGLGRDMKKVHKAVTLGMLNNLILIVVITFCSLLTSKEVTEVAISGWSDGIGEWARILGGIFTVLAIITSYWSISLALSQIVMEQTALNSKLCWLLATLPSLLLAVFSSAGFIDFLELTSGACAIIVAVMLIPTYRNAERDVPGSSIKLLTTLPCQIAVVISYLLMAIGSLI